MNKNVYMYDNLNRKKITQLRLKQVQARPVSILSTRTWPKRDKSKKKHYQEEQQKQALVCYWDPVVKADFEIISIEAVTWVRA